MNRRWLLAVPFLSALFWGSCRDPMSNHVERDQPDRLHNGGAS